MGRKRTRCTFSIQTQDKFYALIANVLDEIIICKLLQQEQLSAISWPLPTNELIKALGINSITKSVSGISWVKCFQRVRSLKRAKRKVGWEFVETDHYKVLKSIHKGDYYLSSLSDDQISDLQLRVSAMEEVLFLICRSHHLIKKPWKDDSKLRTASYARNHNGENVLHILLSLPDHDKWIMDLIIRTLQTLGWNGMQDLTYDRMNSPLHVAILNSFCLAALYKKISVLKNQSEEDSYDIHHLLKLQNEKKSTALHVYVESVQTNLDRFDVYDIKEEEEILETLSKGIIDTQDQAGKTPLHLVQYDRSDLIKLIFDNKPTLSMCDYNGDPPFLSLIVRAENRFSNLLQHLMSNMEKLKRLTKLFPSSAVFLPNTKTNRNILHFLADDTLQYIDSGPYYYGGYRSRIEEVFLVFLSLEDAKTALVAQSFDGHIPLHTLIKCFAMKSVANLSETFESVLEIILSCVIDGNANVNQQDASKNTILHYLVESYITIKTKPLETLNSTKMESIRGKSERFCGNMLRLVTILVEQNADVNIKGMEGSSVQELADKFGEDELIQSLRKKGTKLVFRIQHEMYYEKLSDLMDGSSMRQIKHYRFHEDKLAEGCMGEVYVAVNEKDRRELALKRVKKVLKDSQVKSEIKALCSQSQKDAPNIVNYYDLIEDDNFYYIALELMDGDLNDFIVRHGHSEPNHKLKSLSRDILRGIKYLHDQELLHRDIKPGNVLYTTKAASGEFVLKICDFGLVKNLGTTLSSLSYRHMGRSFAGTRAWMAPELVKSVDNIVHTKESDIFAVGLVIHFLISLGRHPFHKYLNLPSKSIAIGIKVLPHVIESNIEEGKKTLYEKLGREEQHFLSGLLEADMKVRNNWDWIACHPFLWSMQKKRSFRSAVGDQIEVAKPASAKDQTFFNALESSSLA